MADDEYDCGHDCCDERGDRNHDHFLEFDVCPRCVTLRGRTVARLRRQDDLVQGWITEEAVARLVGQTPRSTYDSTDVGRVRIVRAWVEDGWVVVEMEPVDGD